MAERRARIAVDMDEVIADSVGKRLRLYNQRFGEALTVAALGGRTLEQVVPPSRVPDLRAILFDPGYHLDLEVIPGSQQVLRELADRYDVYVASAAMEVPPSFTAKFTWLARHFPFITPSQIVFCGDKSVLDVDYLIDDSPRHFARFRGVPILFSTPYNLAPENDRYTRVRDWSDVRRLLLPAGGGPALVPPPATT